MRKRIQKDVEKRKKERKLLADGQYNLVGSRTGRVGVGGWEE